MAARNSCLVPAPRYSAGVLPAVILLDLDDTILDDTGRRDACWRTACTEAAELWADIDVEALYAEVERVRCWFWSDAERSRAWRSTMRRAWQEIGRLAIEQLGGHPGIGAWIGDRHFELRDEAIAPFPGAVETLSALRARGARLGLITNGSSDAQRAKISRFALEEHFEYVGIEGEVGFGKPDRRAFENALRALDSCPAEAWMVGDNLEWEIEPAQALGIKAIWVDVRGDGLPARSTVVPNRTIRGIGELLG